MRVQWWSNAPYAQTGYGTQTAQVVRRLKADGFDVSISTNYGLQATQSVWEDIPMYPAGMDAYSQDVIAAHWWDWQRRSDDPTLLVTLFDTWILKCESLAKVPVIASWVPIDHLPTPPDVLAWCQRPNVVPIAMARFGSRMLADAGVDHLYVPHAIERVFRPTELLPNGGRTRELLEIDDDAFIVMVNAANKGIVPCRKGFPEMFSAFSVFHREHPEAVLYVHSDMEPGSGGVDLWELANACGIPQSAIRHADAYALRMGVAPEMLAAFYTAADVLLATSMGEGFGIPVVEAQACGTPVIVSDWTAQPELVGDGFAVPAQPWWDAPQRAWFATPSVPHIVEALERIHHRERGPSEKAQRFAADYEADTVYAEYWRPALLALAERFAG